ncbi:S9 family peptidase [Terriglobus tenax]|uniref:S9 family peptidase n=1 Tax=Terriglobus tenax TaxID=1111115 RepID=UPI0021DF463D|nr:S9 family peptidase [Terriglobus tenax]
MRTIAAAVLFSAALLPAQQTSRIPELVNDLAKVSIPTASILSPDGSYVAWVAPGTSGDALHLSASDGTGEDRILSPGGNELKPACASKSPTWAPDSKTLAFLSNCTPDGKRQKQWQLYLWSASDNKFKQLTHLTGALAKPAFSPDGKSVAFLFVENGSRAAGATGAMKPPAGVIGEDGIEIQRVWEALPVNGTVEPLTVADQHVYEFSWAPGSNGLVYIAANPPGENNWWVAKLRTIEFKRNGGPENQTNRTIVDPQSVTGPLHGLQIAVPRFSPDGKTIAFIGGLMSDEGSNGGDIYLVPSTGGEPKIITADRKSTPSWLEWADDSHLVVSEHRRGQAHLGVITTSGTDIPLYHLTLPESIGSGQSAMSVSISLSSKKIALIRQSATMAPEVWAGEMKSLKQISHLNAAMKPLSGKAESIEWKNEGFDVQGWLTLPANYDPSKKYPLIVSVHGGPSSEITSRYGGEPALFSALGYFVFQPNPRGSYGQGEKFTQANRKDFGYGDLRDILAGLDSVEKKFPVDPNRVGLMGWSYGGFMSMFAITQTDRFKAAVAGAGISNWQSYYGENSIDQWMIPFFGASVYDDPAVYAKSSAINYIKNVKTPELIIVGDSDGECPMPQSFEMWHALRDLGVTTQLVVYPGEGHHFANPQHVTDRLERTLRWFEEKMPAKNN